MYIRDPNTTFTFDLKVKFTGFLTYFRGWQKLFWFYIHAFITIRGCVAYIHDPDSTLTFDLNVNFIGFCRLFCLLWHWHTALCSGHSFFLSFDIVILCLAHECINMVQCVVYISWPLYGLDLWPQLIINYIYFHHELVPGKIIIGIPDFGIWVYHHETKCCVHSWPLFDLDLWLICDWRGYP